MLAATFFGGRAGAQEAACGLWDMSVVESGFTPCSLAAWTNDSARLQVPGPAHLVYTNFSCIML